MKDERPTHLDLFSGIGGFALAAQWAGFRTVAFVERELYCQKVIAQHWPKAEIHGDICEFSGTKYNGVSLITGGFPCQPFSVAGEQRGKADDRYLWPEMFRVIREANPYWIIGENVAGLDGLGLDDCISDLESIGYEVAPPLEIPACAVGTKHERTRLWIVANYLRSGLPRWGNTGSNNKDERCISAGAGLASLPANSVSADEWEHEPLLGRGIHGIPNRTHRLKGLGNAIVPQVAYRIIKEIRKLI